jgi:hypothetical protein
MVTGSLATESPSIHARRIRSVSEMMEASTEVFGADELTDPLSPPIDAAT